MPINTNGASVKLMCGNRKVAKIYAGNAVVYSSGSTVTYHVDTGASYTEEFDEGESVLVPKTFVPAKSGWEFLGWREDGAANGNVLSSKDMGDSPLTLYAVYRQVITLSYNGNGNTGGSTAAQTGIRYYNSNGAFLNPSFSLRGNGFSRSGYNFSRWALGSVGGAQHSPGASLTLSSNTTMYAVWVMATRYIIQNGQGSMVELKKQDGASCNFGYSPSYRINGWYNFSYDEGYVWATCRSPILDLRGMSRVVVTVYGNLNCTKGVVFRPSSEADFGANAIGYVDGEKTFTINAPFPSDYCYVGLFLDNGDGPNGCFGIRELRVEP